MKKFENIQKNVLNGSSLKKNFLIAVKMYMYENVNKLVFFQSAKDFT